MELKMKAICEGRKTRREVIDETVEQYRAVYVRTQQRLDVLRTVSAPTTTTLSWLSLNVTQSVQKYVLGQGE